MKPLNQILIIFVHLVLPFTVFAGSKPASPEQVAKLTITACALSKNIQELDHINIYVMDNQKIAQALKKYENQQSGKVKINSIISGKNLPEKRPTVLVCGNNEDCECIKNYCRKNKVLSIAARPKSCRDGLSISLCQELSNLNKESLSQVKILLNLEASLYEEIYWDRNITYVSTIIRPRHIYAIR